MPVIAVLLGVWLLGDGLDSHKLLGGALVIAGLAVINLPGRRRPLPMR